VHLCLPQDFDGVMERLALSNEATASLPNTTMRMASYQAFTKQQLPDTNGHAPACAASPEGASASAAHPPYGGSAAAAGGGDAAASAVSPERLQEAEALKRIGALVSRLAEMEEWFSGVKAEAERERRMREQSAARLQLMQERVEVLSGQVGRRPLPSPSPHTLTVSHRLTPHPHCDACGVSLGTRARTRGQQARTRTQHRAPAARAPPPRTPTAHPHRSIFGRWASCSVRTKRCDGASRS
jgi:hypothetical protein